MHHHLRALVSVLLLSRASVAAPTWEEGVAAILRTRCAGCHQDGDASGGLSMETFAALRAGGDAGDPIVPGDPAASLLARRLAADGDDHMPPADQPQPTDAERERLLAWIAAGAPGPEHDRSILADLIVPALPPADGPRGVTALAVTPDGRRLAVARGASVELRDDTGGVALAGLPRRVDALHFSPDGATLVVAGGTPGLAGTVQLRDAAGGAVVRVFDGHRDLVHDAELSPDGTLLASAGYDRSVRLWDAASGTLVRTIDVHTGAVFDLAWHPSGKVLATASADETVKLWRVADGERLDTLKEPQGEVRAVLFTPDGRHVVAGGRDKRIHVWRFLTLDEPGLNPALQARFAHEGPIVALAVSPDGRSLLSAAEDLTVASWSVPDLVPAGQPLGQSDVAAALAPLGGGRFRVGRMDGTLDVVTPAAVAPVAAAGQAPHGPERTDDGAVGEPVAIDETEPNDAPGDAGVAAAGAGASGPANLRFSGRIGTAADADLVPFRARRGERLVLEVNAARSGSKLDSRLEVLHADGRPVERVTLQATRDSWFTFRGKDSNQSDDFRLHNWKEMELDEYLWAGGEVVRLWLYPRGPDSGFKVYPGTGTRHAFFDTTPVTHALGEPAWIVTPLAAGAAPVPNGLPLFRLFFENDDASHRRFGADSLLTFTAPADGDYHARVTDVRGFGAGPQPDEWRYTLAIRPPRPSFIATLGSRDPAVSPGSAREIPFSVVREEGFEGAVRISIGNLPAGFTFHGPLEIEAGQERAIGLLSAAPDATDPDPAADAAVRVLATATIAGREVVQELGTLGDLKLGAGPKLAVEILDAAGRGRTAPDEPLRFRIRPGETIAARVRAARHDFAERIELGGDDSGRNLPFGCYVDNIGLNGLLIVEGQSEREFFITASPVARPGRRLFHLRATADGGQASLPAEIEVLPADAAAE